MANAEANNMRQYLENLQLFIRYILSKWMWFVLLGLLLGVAGVVYAWRQKAVYTAELTFAAENESGSAMSSYAGIAAQFGFDLGGGGGSVFEGDNLMLLLRSRLLLEKTLLTPVDVQGGKELLINYYLRTNIDPDDLKKDTILKRIDFSAPELIPDRARDSVMKAVIETVTKNSLMIDKVDKKVNIIAVRLRGNDEIFVKMFVEQLVNNAIQFYVDYKIKKTRQNVQILQHQTDSVRRMLSGNIVSVASSNDLNINPLRQIVRVGTQQKQVDMQANGQVYGELLKQLEFSKITLRKETPLVQIIDTPQLPLDKKKPGRLLTGIIFSVLGCIVLLVFFIAKRIYNNAMQTLPGNTTVSTSV